MEGQIYARQAFDQELQQLEHELLSMASRVEAMIVDSVDSLMRLDRSMAMSVMTRDDEIDQLDLEIESMCMRTLALQSPRGSDLRFVSSILKVIVDIERVADLCVDVAKITLKIDNEGGETEFLDIKKMSLVCQRMFRESIEAFVWRDLNRVSEIERLESDSDALYRELRSHIFARMKSDPDSVVSDGWLLLAVHHLERIADHAVNVAERVTYMVTGELKQITA